MIKYFFCTTVSATLLLFSCGSPTTTETESEQTGQRIERDQIPETQQLQETIMEENMEPTVEAADNTANPVQPADNTRQNNPQNNKEINKITVSFISIGEGIDLDAAESYKSYIDNWKSASGKTLSYETIYWGREGETDYCLDMSSISDNESKKLLLETQERFKDNTLVQIETNQACKESRIRK